MFVPRTWRYDSRHICHPPQLAFADAPVRDRVVANLRKTGALGAFTHPGPPIGKGTICGHGAEAQSQGQETRQIQQGNGRGEGSDHVLDSLGGSERDIDHPAELLDDLLESGQPKLERLNKKLYESELVRLQTDLVKMQYWIRDTGYRMIVLFEGRDAAGKGGTIKRLTEPLNPRGVALLPSERRRNARKVSGISSVMWNISLQQGRSLSLIAVGTTGWRGTGDGVLHPGRS